MANLIFDFGSNIGKNLSYYLMKADVVVAVEANSALNAEVRKKFAKEVSEGSLIIEECIVSTRSLINQRGRVQKFFINIENNLVSTLVESDINSFDSWQQVDVIAFTASEVVSKYLKSDDVLLYCKFDLEGMDSLIVEELLSDGLHPEYISLELNDPRGFDMLVASSIYRSFKLSPGYEIGRRLRNVKFKARNGELVDYSFETHSAGPCFPDLPNPTFDFRASNFIRLLKFRLRDWTDIHASKELENSPSYVEQLFLFLKLSIEDLQIRFRTIWARVRKPLVNLLPHGVRSFLKATRNR